MWARCGEGKSESHTLAENSFYSFNPADILIFWSRIFNQGVDGDCSDMGFSTLMASCGMKKLARDLNSSK